MTYIIFYQDQRGGCHKTESVGTAINGMDDIVFMESSLTLAHGCDCYITGMVEVKQ